MDFPCSALRMLSPVRFHAALLANNVEGAAPAPRRQPLLPGAQ